MNGTPHEKASGSVARVDFKGAGPGSGHYEIALEPVHLSFFVFLDTPRPKYFEIFEKACVAMWDSKQVEIAYAMKDGDRVVKEIRIL